MRNWISVKITGRALRAVEDQLGEKIEHGLACNRAVRKLILDGLRYRKAKRKGLIEKSVPVLRKESVESSKPA